MGLGLGHWSLEHFVTNILLIMRLFQLDDEKETPSDQFYSHVDQNDKKRSIISSKMV